MPAETAPIQFAEYELDARRFELRRDGFAVSLERLPMDLLILLATHPGELVSRAEIVAALWGSGGIHVDTETGINTAIRKIRRALNDDIQNPRFIHTVSGKGYRFEAPATVNVTTETQSDRPEPSAIAPHDGGLWNRVKPRARLGVTAVAILIFMGIAAWQISRGGNGAAEGKARLAILPFENLSPDPQNAFFADGLHEEILSTLSERGAGLEVVSRTTMMSYRQNPKPVAAVAKELRATYVLEGSVRRDGQGVRVSLQLIDARNDRNLWSHSYDRALPDSLTLQTDIATEVAAQLATRLTKLSGPAPVPADIEVYDDYLRAVLMTQASSQGVKETQLRNAEALLTRAISRDSSFGRAYAARATAGVALFTSGVDASEDRVRRIRDDLEAARRLIGDDSTVLVAEGYYWAAVMRDYPRVLNAYRVAEAAGNADANILLGKGVALLRMGRVAEALAALEQGAALDPGNIAELSLWATALWAANRPADALRVSDLMGERMPGFPPAAGFHAEIVFGFTGKTDEYRAMAANIADPPTSLKLRFNVLCYERRFAELKPMLDGVALQAIRVPGLNGGAANGAGLIPVASYRGWADLLVGDPVGAATEGQAELDFVARQPETDWNRWYHRLLTAEGYLFEGQMEQAIASAREGISLMPRSRDAVTWRQAALMAAQILSWAGAGDEAVALLTELSKAKPGIGPAQITRDPLIADPLAQNPKFQSLSRDLEAKMRDFNLP